MIVHVAFPLPIAKTFSYLVPPGWRPFIQLYRRVKVPFQGKINVGFVVGVDEGTEDDLKGLLEIQEIVDLFPLPNDTLIHLSEWASRHSITPLGLVLKSAIPLKLSLEKYLMVKTGTASIPGLDGTPLNAAYSNFGKETVFQYYSGGLIEVCDVFTGKRFAPLTETSGPGKRLERTLLVDNVQNRLECYLTLVSEEFMHGRNVIMHVPDYHASGRFFYRMFVEKFPGRVVWYGTAVSLKKRMETYFRARNENGLLILGNRSGVFLPVKNHSLTIVERHEDDGYRNEESFRFNAALLAIKRAELEQISIVLGTASPSMEIFKRAQEEEFHLLERDWGKNRKCGESIMEKKRSYSSGLPDELKNLVGAAIEKRESVAIYTPRKDYTSHIRCLDCRELLLCPTCQSVLSYRKESNQLHCTGCKKFFPYGGQCTLCGSSLLSFSRIGAEYIEKELRDVFQDANLVRVDGKTINKDLKTLVGMLRNPPVIVVGTQTLSKLYGIQIDKLILLGWEDLMTSLGFRAAERMFQILANLADALCPGEIHFIMERRKKVDSARFLDSKTFYEDELKKRKSAEFPPYVRIFLIEIEKKMEKTGDQIVKKIMKITEDAGLTGRVTGPVVQKKKRYRWRIVLKGNEEFIYQPLWDIYCLPGVQVEADPLFI